jgi:hypothetical protein
MGNSVYSMRSFMAIRLNSIQPVDAVVDSYEVLI